MADFSGAYVSMDQYPLDDEVVDDNHWVTWGIRYEGFGLDEKITRTCVNTDWECRQCIPYQQGR